VQKARKSARRHVIKQNPAGVGPSTAAGGHTNPFAAGGDSWGFGGEGSGFHHPGSKPLCGTAAARIADGDGDGALRSSPLPFKYSLTDFHHLSVLPDYYDAL